MAQTLRDLGRPLASGNEADVFAYGDILLKVTKRSNDSGPATHEARILAALAPLGLAPRVDGVIEVDGHWGVLMERIHLPVMASALSAPDLFPELLELMVSLHGRIHAVTAPPEVPALKQRMATRIGRAERIAPDLRSALLTQLTGMPDGDRLCHGDFHPFNILGLDQHARVIDWLDATRGDPAADVCRTELLISTYDAGMAQSYAESYCLATGVERRAVEAWLPLVAAARLAENVPDEFDRLVQLAQGGTLG